MSEFVDYLTEVFEPFGKIHSRRMFGGHGIYHDGLMFGLVADDQLYLKADADSVGYFHHHELPAFEYDKNGKLMKMSYFLAPESIFDDTEEAITWARRAYDAALRARSRKR
ncbi:MAG: TfoX/Sxy family protein [Woeseiaceae bacterium]